MDADTTERRRDHHDRRGPRVLLGRGHGHLVGNIGGARIATGGDTSSGAEDWLATAARRLPATIFVSAGAEEAGYRRDQWRVRGLGFTNCLYQDIRIASDTARMGLIFVQRGLAIEHGLVDAAADRGARARGRAGGYRPPG